MAKGQPAKFGQIEPRIKLIAYEGQPDLAKFCPEAARQNLAKSSRDSLKISGLQKGAARFGQILPGGCPAKFGQIEPRISHRVRRAARFGQILPADCPAKSGQIEPRLSGGPKLFKLSRLGLAKFCREVRAKFGQTREPRQILPGIWPNRAAHFSWHTKSSPIWPNFARRLPGKIWPNRAAIV